MSVHHRFARVVVCVCMVGCSKSGTETVLERIRAQPAAEIVANVKISLLGADGAPLLHANTPVGREFAVGGSFHAIGDAATIEFKHQFFFARLLKKSRDGTFKVDSSCTCPVAGKGPEYTFSGTMRAISEPGEYLLRASYAGTNLAECTITVR